MGNGSFIGFHAAYVERGGRATESGVGNALLGSYLTQIGLSESAVVYLTKAAPTEMTWLNSRDAKQIGIDVIPWVSVQSSSKPAQPPGPLRNATGEDLATRAPAPLWPPSNQDGLTPTLAGWLGLVPYTHRTLIITASAFLGMWYSLTNVASLNAGRSDRTKSQPIQ